MSAPKRQGESLDYVARLSRLADVTNKRELRRELLQMVGEELEHCARHKPRDSRTILRGLELAARLTSAYDPAQPFDASNWRQALSVFDAPAPEVGRA